MQKIQRIEEYIFNFFSSRFEDITDFYKASHANRRYEIYPLKDGTKLMDFIMSIHGNIEEGFYFEKLVPHKYATPDALFSALNAFKEFLIEHQYLLDQNLDGEDTAYPIAKLLHLKGEFIAMIDYVKQIYDIDDTLAPYQNLRYYLISKNIEEFVKTLKSILASVSYAIVKSKEGYHHSNVHLVLKLLGFEIVSEESTNRGRIDAVIRFIDVIYILEFKFSKEKDESDIALDQIKFKGYAEKYYVERKYVYGIGISFSEQERNINGFTYEKLL